MFVLVGVLIGVLVRVLVAVAVCVLLGVEVKVGMEVRVGVGVLVLGEQGCVGDELFLGLAPAATKSRLLLSVSVQPPSSRWSEFSKGKGAGPAPS